MFIGHFAIGFGAKKWAPTVSLGVLFVACQLADLIWPVLVLLGIEQVAITPGITTMTPLDFQHYPWSHSLVLLAAWSGLFALVYLALTRAGWRIALVVALVAFSHWVLDFLTHRPDLPLAPGASQKLGIGLWNLPAVAIALELGLFALGLWLYGRHTRPVDRVGSYALWGLAAFLLLAYVVNLLGPPPPSADTVARSALAFWGIVAWGFWIDRHRVPV
ncbi:MAG: hypothetical protein HKP02_02460 [Xanthomonadales bacterium]|nr:hypothetical protein [Xanthomonadales bacterium]